MGKALSSYGNAAEPTLVVDRGLSFVPFVSIFEGKEIDRWEILHPLGLGSILKTLPTIQAFVRHWADGVAVDDCADGQNFSFALRLHREGAAGIVQNWEANYIDLRTTARALPTKLSRF